MGRHAKRRTTQGKEQLLPGRRQNPDTDMHTSKKKRRKEKRKNETPRQNISACLGYHYFAPTASTNDCIEYKPFCFVSSLSSSDHVQWVHLPRISMHCMGGKIKNKEKNPARTWDWDGNNGPPQRPGRHYWIVDFHRQDGRYPVTCLLF